MNAKISGSRRPAAERYWEKVDKRGPDDCWPWLGTIRKAGYGELRLPGVGTKYAHRIGWLLRTGSLPEGLVIDHNCHNLDPLCTGRECLHRRCQNPAHLRAITQAGNALAGKTIQRENALKDACDHGHPFDDENTYLRRNGWRECRTCLRERKRRYAAEARHGCATCGTPIGARATHCHRHKKTRGWREREGV